MQQLSTDPAVLSMFFTEEVFLVPEAQVSIPAPPDVPVNAPSVPLPAEDPAPVAVAPDKPVQAEPAAAAKSQMTFAYKGQNAKKVVIIVNDAQNDVSTDEGRELLRKIVKSVNLSGNDFALLNHARKPEATFADYCGFFPGCLFLMFGVHPADLRVAGNVQHELVQAGAEKFILTSELHALNSDAGSKKALWSTLQKLQF